MIIYFLNAHICLWESDVYAKPTSLLKHKKSPGFLYSSMGDVKNISETGNCKTNFMFSYVFHHETEVIFCRKPKPQRNGNQGFFFSLFAII